jgi:hypothetical protein
MLELYGGIYRGWNVKHFHEHLMRDHGHTLVKMQLHTAGLVERAKRRGANRRKRERKPFEGMIVGRALKHLEVEHIPTYSPEARGRSKRMFGTCRTG